MKQLNKNLQPSLNLLTQNNQQNTQQENRQNNSQQNRRNNQQNYQNNNRNNNNNNQNYRRNNNYNNGRQNNNRNYNNNYNNNGRQNNWQNRGPNNQYQNNAQSSRKYCNNCNKFGHTPASCWFRQHNHQPPALPYQQYSSYAPPPQQQLQPQMTNPMIPPYNPVTTPWSPYYDANMVPKN